jgi:CheY-like chemotaxis protein
VSRRVLIVEDNDEDFMEVVRVIDRSSLGIVTLRCIDGKDALDLVNSSAKHDLPSLIMLDLNLARMSGHTVLRSLKADAATRVIPVVIVSTSNSHDEVRRCFDAGAAGYICKVIDHQRFAQTLRTLITYWFDTSLLPVG